MRLEERFPPTGTFLPYMYTPEHNFTSDPDGTVAECTQAKLRWARGARSLLMSHKTDARSAAKTF